MLGCRTINVHEKDGWKIGERCLDTFHMSVATTDDKAVTHVYTRRESCAVESRTMQKRLSVLVRLDYCSEFNVGGLECAIITERAHGPCLVSMYVSTTAVSLRDCQEQWRGRGSDGIIGTKNEVLVVSSTFK